MNGIVVVDKPAGMTSHDVVARLRRLCNTRRVGHSGTLDPMATGVLPVFVGRATRACEFALCDDKIYRARLRLGLRTDTQDITGTVISEREVNVGIDELRSTCAKFVGKIMQTPPMYSAIKVDGVPLYKLARKGEEIKRKAREITVHSIDVSHIENDEYELTVECGSGTYIRTLCDDIGECLGCGATMTALRRLRSGAFDISEAKTLEELENSPHLLPVDSMFAMYKSVTIDAKSESRCRNGAPVRYNAKNGETYRVYGEDGSFLMLARGDESGNLITVKSFFEV